MILKHEKNAKFSLCTNLLSNNQNVAQALEGDCVFNHDNIGATISTVTRVKKKSEADLKRVRGGGPSMCAGGG